MLYRTYKIGKDGLIRQTLKRSKSGIFEFKEGSYLVGNADATFYSRYLFFWLLPSCMYREGNYTPLPVVFAAPELHNANEFGSLVTNISLSLFGLLKDTATVKENIMLYLLVGIVCMLGYVFFIGGV